jgi:hypothetical protein
MSHPYQPRAAVTAGFRGGCRGARDAVFSTRYVVNAAPAAAEQAPPYRESPGR